MIVWIGIVTIIAFVIGSIPFGVLLAKLFRLPDPRGIGSGNIGATNMLRTGHKGVAAFTLLLDALKGAIPVMIGGFIIGTVSYAAQGIHQNPYAVNQGAAYALLIALLAHCYTPWLKGKGGKGVATALGGSIIFSIYIAWPLSLAFCATWLLVFVFTRYVSLASIVALLTLPVMAAITLDPGTAILFGLCAIISIWRHRSNIERLKLGTEPKMGRK